MKLAVLTTRLFDQPRDGGELCTARLLHALAQAGHELVVVGRGTPPQRATSYQSVGPLVTPFEQMPPVQRVASLAAAVAMRRAWTVQRLAAGGVPRQVARLLREQRQAGALDGVVVDHLQAWPWLVAAGPDLPPTWLVMHNLESDGYDEQARTAPGLAAHALLAREARRLNALEAQALQRCRAVACLSAADASALRARAAGLGARVHVDVLPGHPWRLPAGDPPAAMDVTRPDRLRVGLMGSWTWGPNRQGLDWMLAQVLPLLPVHCEVVLAGSGLDGVALPPRVCSLGRVADVSQFYGHVDVVAVPSLQGSGVQEKAIDAIALGRAVVATPHALRGLGPGLPPHVHVAGQADDFARSCVDAALAAAAVPAEVHGWAARRAAAYRAAVQRCLQALADERPPADALPAA